VALVRKRTIPTERPPLVGEAKLVPTFADDDDDDDDDNNNNNNNNKLGVPFSAELNVLILTEAYPPPFIVSSCAPDATTSHQNCFCCHGNDVAPNRQTLL
jgi:hypothetical protein